MSEAQPKPSDPQRLHWGRIAIGVPLGVLALVGAVAVLVFLKSGFEGKTAKPEPVRIHTAPPPKPREKTAEEIETERRLELARRMKEETDLIAAVNLMLPLFGDTYEDQLEEPAALAIWANQRGVTWSDLHRIPQTEHALVMKDPHAERGKLLCANGRVVQIRTSREAMLPFYRGVFSTQSLKVISFYAFGSTGNLVERSHARFCGSVVGTYSYNNTGGGTTHSVFAVGMFDLPENRTPRAASATL